MLCFTNKKKSFFLSLLFLFSVLLSSVFIYSENSYALDDIVLTSNTNSICYQGDPSNRVNCYNLGYRYLYYQLSSVSTQSYTTAFTLITRPTTNSSANFQVPAISYFGLFELSSDVNVTGVSSYSSTYVSRIVISDHLPSSLVPSSPTGNIDISQNGSYDVTSYATATVNVENEVIYGDYHDDLITINNSILTCGAICLVIYFFYCIYRIIIKNSGVK